MFKRLLPVGFVLAAILAGSYHFGLSSDTPASADVPPGCVPDLGPPVVNSCDTSFTVDLIPGGAVDAVAIKDVGVPFSVNVLLDTYTGPAWDTWQVELEYTDLVLDGCGNNNTEAGFMTADTNGPPDCLGFGMPLPNVAIGGGTWATAPVLNTTGGQLMGAGATCTPGPTASPAGEALDKEDDLANHLTLGAAYALSCFYSSIFGTGAKDVVQFVFQCDTVGVASLMFTSGGTFILDATLEEHRSHYHGATVTCQVPPPASPTPTNTPVPPTNTPTNTFTATNTFTPTTTPNFEAATMHKKPLSANQNNNVVSGGDLPAVNLFICEPDNDPSQADGPADGDCDGDNEGSVTWIEMGNSPVDPIGAFEFQIKFDHKIFDINLECVTEADPGTDCTLLDAETWDIQLSPELLNDPNRVWSMDQCFRNVTENYINFACTSTGPPDQGPTGLTELAYVTVHPDEDLKFRLRPGNDNGIVRVILDENCELVDPLGHPVEGSIAGGLTTTCGDIAVTVRILEGDLDLNCVVTLSDAQAIAQLYGMVFGLFLYDPWYDLEPNITDFDIDAKDLQKVFGRIDSTCQVPKPPQPPLLPPQA
jgi:hypothetical protein